MGRPPPPPPKHKFYCGVLLAPPLPPFCTSCPNVSKFVLSHAFCSSQYPCLWTVSSCNVNPGPAGGSVSCSQGQGLHVDRSPASSSPGSVLQGHTQVGTETVAEQHGHIRLGGAGWAAVSAHSFWRTSVDISGTCLPWTSDSFYLVTWHKWMNVFWFLWTRIIPPSWGQNTGHFFAIHAISGKVSYKCCSRPNCLFSLFSSNCYQFTVPNLLAVVMDNQIVSL